MLSRTFKTVFVHIPKTGGQSVEQVFLDKEGLTWKTRAPLLLRPNSDPALGPKRLAHLYATEYVSCGHMSADDFANYFKFTVVRDPYARLISRFRYKNPRGLSFGEFVEELPQVEDEHYGRQLAAQVTFVTDEQGKLLVDEVIRFESLAAGFASVSERVFGEALPLPHVNKSKGEAPADPYDTELRRIVYRRYERDFDVFRYPSGLVT